MRKERVDRNVGVSFVHLPLVSARMRQPLGQVVCSLLMGDLQKKKKKTLLVKK